MSTLSPLPAPTGFSDLVRDMLADVEARRRCPHFWLAMPVLIALARLLQEMAKAFDRLAEQIRAGAYLPGPPLPATPARQAQAADEERAPAAPRPGTSPEAARRPVPRPGRANAVQPRGQHQAAENPPAANTRNRPAPRPGAASSPRGHRRHPAPKTARDTKGVSATGFRRPFVEKTSMDPAGKLRPFRSASET